jgi:hypothetical protein
MEQLELNEAGVTFASSRRWQSIKAAISNAEGESTMSITKYKFRPMIGPAADHPPGTREWAECVGNEIDFMIDRVIDDIRSFGEVVRKYCLRRAPDQPWPWEVWPDPPCGSMEVVMHWSQ